MLARDARPDGVHPPGPSYMRKRLRISDEHRRREAASFTAPSASSLARPRGVFLRRRGGARWRCVEMERERRRPRRHRPGRQAHRLRSSQGRGAIHRIRAETDLPVRVLPRRQHRLGDIREGYRLLRRPLRQQGRRDRHERLRGFPPLDAGQLDGRGARWRHSARDRRAHVEGAVARRRSGQRLDRAQHSGRSGGRPRRPRLVVAAESRLARLSSRGRGV